MKLDVLAIAAHPDDVEITCGGLMIKLADAGKKTGILDLTQGEMGTLGTPSERLKEADKAGKILGLAVRENLRLPDSNLELSRQNKKKIAAVIRKYQPQTVILPHKSKQRHPDHKAASILGYEACYLAGLKKAEISGEPHRPRKILYSSFFLKVDHSFFVDITEQLERKLEAVAAYTSQFNDAMFSSRIYKPDTDIFDLIKTVHRLYGIDIGCRYAEPYWIPEPVLLDDPTSQPVRSI